MRERRAGRDPGEQHRIDAADAVRVIIETAGGGVIEDAVVRILRDAAMDEGVRARLLAVLLQAARGDPDGWTPTGFYSAAATRTVTSRVHVRTVLHLARDAGLVELSDDADGRVRVSTELREGFAKWAAHALLAVDLVSAFSVESARQRRG